MCEAWHTWWAGIIKVISARGEKSHILLNFNQEKSEKYNNNTECRL